MMSRQVRDDALPGKQRWRAASCYLSAVSRGQGRGRMHTTTITLLRLFAGIQLCFHVDYVVWNVL